MHLFQQARTLIIATLREYITSGFLPEDIPLDAITAEPPKNAAHGDIAPNAAMVVSKAAKKPPREIAEKLAEKLGHASFITHVTIAGPGFINLHLTAECWLELLQSILKQGTAYGDGALDEAEKERINIEYVSANPTGPVHIGHARGAVIGDVLANLLAKAGHHVTKEYYINDAGNQMDILAKSAYLRYQEALGKTIETMPEGLYPGDYLVSVGKALAASLGDSLCSLPEEEWLPPVRHAATDQMMERIRTDLASMGITHDIFTSERALIEQDAIEKGLAILQKAGLVYTGVLDAPKGKAPPEDWEPQEQLLFRSSAFGDDSDRPLKKSDGTTTYFASDVAYHHDKLKRNFYRMIVILGADHGGYVKRLQALVSALASAMHTHANLDALLYQLVHFYDQGKPMKMSKRAGTYVTVQDVIDAVGKDALRFLMLTRKADAPLDFDLQKATEQSKDNPIFYVQYAHARICSVLRRAKEEIEGDTPHAKEEVPLSTLSLLTHPAEKSLMQLLAQWPRIVESSAKLSEPHRIAYYVQDVAASLHGLWNLGKEEDIRFIVPEEKTLTQARLALLQATAITIASGLKVMGITPLESM